MAGVAAALCAVFLMVFVAFTGGLYIGKKTAGVGIEKLIARWWDDLVGAKNTFKTGSATDRMAWETMYTGLHGLQVARIPLGDFPAVGGGIDLVGDNILFVTPRGGIGYVSGQGELRTLPVSIDLRYQELTKHAAFAHPKFNREWVRVSDIITIQNTERSYDLFVSHHYYQDDCIELRISRVHLEVVGDLIRVTDPNPDTVFTATPCVPFNTEAKFVFGGHLSGGRMLRYDDYTLLFSVGDHLLDGVDDPKMAMNTEVTLGKIMRMDLGTLESEIFAIGVRNPQGLYLDDQGRIWETEHGPQGGDELNILYEGENYGWPEVTLGTEYGNQPWPFNPSQGRHEGYREPIYAFMPSIGISNLTMADARQFPNWKGDLLVASLRKQTLFRLRLRGESVVYAEPIPLGERLRDILTLPDGSLALYSDSDNIILIRNKDVEPGPEALQMQVAQLDRSSLGDKLAMLETDMNAHPYADPGETVFQSRCASCHSMAEINQVGPHLAGLMGRPVGSVEGYPYSVSLKRQGRNWDGPLLRAFLENPQGKDFGQNNMPNLGLSAEEVDALAAYFAKTATK